MTEQTKPEVLATHGNMRLEVWRKGMTFGKDADAKDYIRLVKVDPAKPDSHGSSEITIAADAKSARLASLAALLPKLAEILGKLAVKNAVAEAETAKAARPMTQDEMIGALLKDPNAIAKLAALMQAAQGAPVQPVSEPVIDPTIIAAQPVTAPAASPLNVLGI